jgi:aminoglycoside 3-N-acetyltransferase
MIRLFFISSACAYTQTSRLDIPCWILDIQKRLKETFGKMNKNEIKQGLQALGLKEGDIVLLHSSLSSMGNVEGGAETVVDAFLETLGKPGTLIVPVFGDLGILTVTVKSRPDAVLSDCPKGTVAAIGADARKICIDHWKADTVHGEGSPYLKIAGLGGYICLLGVDQDRNTSMHSVEALLQLPYLNPVSDLVQTPEGGIQKTWKYYPGPHRDFIGLDKLLRSSGKMKTCKIGNAVTRLIKSQDLIELLTDVGHHDPAFCLCDNPECADCVSQRAAIFRDTMGKENFKLAASSALSGRYVPEIIDNLHSCGIGYVELDFIQGKPAHLMSSEKLQMAVREFTGNSISVSELRLPGVMEDMEKTLQLAKDCGIARLVLPLCADTANLTVQAVAENIALSFCNCGIAGNYASKIMKDLTGHGMNAGFTFSPAEFARCGEKPFLHTFSFGKFRKYMDQLDIEDGTFAGMPTALGRGNAEIKELVSILRCASFGGFMTLAASNRHNGNIAKIAVEFRKLLDEI